MYESIEKLTLLTYSIIILICFRPFLFFFANRIFEIKPDAAAYFKFTDGFETTDEALYKQEVFIKHVKMVVLTVTSAVDLLEKENMDELFRMLKLLGAKHLSAGLKLEKEHYNLVGMALLDTLGKALGGIFTEAVKSAWIGVYAIIASKMMEGAEEYLKEEKKQD